MTLWYNPPSQNSAYASLGGVDKSGATISFSELLIKNEGDFVSLLGKAEAISDIKQAQNPSYKFEPCLVHLKLTAKEYTRTYQGSSTVKKPSDKELALIKMLSPFEGKPMGGQVSLEIPEFVAQDLISNPESDLAKAFSSKIVSLSELSSFHFIKTEELPKTGKGGFGSSAKYQSVSDRLDEKLKWLINQIDDREVKAANLNEFADYLTLIAQKQPQMYAVLDILISNL